MRIALIGPGDIEFHYQKILNISKDKLEKEIIELSRVLNDYEICFLPDKGICYEIAKKCKNVTATTPLSDKDFGIRHLEHYRKIAKKEIDIGNWYKQHLVQILIGDVVLVLGNSLGTIGELTDGLYLYKLFEDKKPEVKAIKNKIHPEIKAGTKIPFTIIIYRPFFKEKLNFELEQYIKKVNAKLIYINNPKELKSILENLLN